MVVRRPNSDLVWDVTCDLCGEVVTSVQFVSSIAFYKEHLILCSNACIDLYCLNPLPYGDKKPWSKLERVFDI